jgi:hypothetical protein
LERKARRRVCLLHIALARFAARPQLKQGTKSNRVILLIEGLAVACEVSMTDFHRIPNSNAGIDAVGWLFLAFACAIIAVAAVIAYEANVAQMMAR